VVSRLGKDRLTEIDEMARGFALKYRDAAEKGDATAEALFWKYLGLALEAAKGRAPYETPRYAAIAVQDQRATESRVISGGSAKERLRGVGAGGDCGRPGRGGGCAPDYDRG